MKKFYYYVTTLILIFMVVLLPSCSNNANIDGKTNEILSEDSDKTEIINPKVDEKEESNKGEEEETDKGEKEESNESTIPVITYNVILTSTNGGKVAGDGTYKQGEEVTIMAIPDTNYKFIEWNDGNKQISKNAVVKFEITKNQIFCAVFERVYKKAKEYKSDMYVTNPNIESWSYSITDGFRLSLIPIINITPTKTTKIAEVNNGILYEFGFFTDSSEELLLNINQLTTTSVSTSITKEVKGVLKFAELELGGSYSETVETTISQTKGITTQNKYTWSDYSPYYLYNVVLVGDYKVYKREVFSRYASSPLINNDYRKPTGKPKMTYYEIDISMATLKIIPVYKQKI